MFAHRRRTGMLVAFSVVTCLVADAALASPCPPWHPSQSFEIHAAADSNGPAIRTLVDDLNGDGAPEILVSKTPPTAGAPMELTILHNNGGGAFLQTTLLQRDEPPFVPVALLDVDRDGRSEILELHTDVQYVGRDGDGWSLAPQTLLAAADGAEYTSVAVADFNGDGLDDIAAASKGDNVVRVFAADPSTPGAFTLYASIPTGEYPFHIQTGDFNADNTVDLYVCWAGPQSSGGYYDGAAVVFINRGAGVFEQTCENILLAFMDEAVIAPETADLDNDGADDLVIPCPQGDDVIVFWNDGAGVEWTTTRTPIGDLLIARIQAGDIDGDGLTDLVLAQPYTRPPIHVLRNLGSRQFAPPVETPLLNDVLFVPEFTLADFNQDGKADATGRFSYRVSYGSSTVQVVTTQIWLNSGDTNAGGAKQITMPTDIVSVAAGDFGGDGAPNFVTAHNDGQLVLHLWTGADIASTTLLTANGSWDDLVSADFDNDGDADLLGAGEFDAEPAAIVLRNNGGGAHEETARIPLPASADSIAVGDLDDNGLVDLIIGGGYSESIMIAQQTSAGVFAAPTAYAVPGRPLHAVAIDADGDGDLDVVVALRSIDGLAVLENTGAGFVGGASIPAGPTPERLATADLNRDGLLDLVVANTGSVFDGSAFGDSISVLLHNGVGFAPPQSLYAGAYPADVATIDVDGDGDLDVVSIASLSGVLVMHLNDGAGAFPQHRQASVGAMPKRLVAADFNADGRPDFAASQWSLVSVGWASVLLSNPRCDARGDMNCDGALNAFDIDPFVSALISQPDYVRSFPTCDYSQADANGDGAVNAFDIDPFVQLLVGE